jgi:hypothetical protein
VDWIPSLPSAASPMRDSRLGDAPTVGAEEVLYRNGLRGGNDRCRGRVGSGSISPSTSPVASNRTVQSSDRSFSSDSREKGAWRSASRSTRSSFARPLSRAFSGPLPMPPKSRSGSATLQALPSGYVGASQRRSWLLDGYVRRRRWASRRGGVSARLLAATYRFSCNLRQGQHLCRTLEAPNGLGVPLDGRREEFGW